MKSARSSTPIGFHGQAFVWWNDLQDYIVRSAPNAQLLLDRTNASAYLNGVEFSGELLAGREWSLYGNLTYTYGQNTTADEPLSRIPPMQGILGLRRRWNGGDNWLDVYAWIVGTQDRLSTRDVSDSNRIPAGGTPGYATVNFRFGRMITERQRLSINVENIFDEQYRVHGSGKRRPRNRRSADVRVAPLNPDRVCPGFANAGRLGRFDH